LKPRVRVLGLKFLGLGLRLRFLGLKFKVLGLIFGVKVSISKYDNRVLVLL
jgi:hypothetical protein